MAIRTLKICTPCLVFWNDVPAPTSFVGDQRPAVSVSNLAGECCVLLDGLEAVADRKCRAFELT